MEDIITIEDYLNNGINEKIAKQHKSPLCGILVLIAGILLLIISLKMVLPDALKMTLLTLGGIGIIAGFLMLVFGATGRCYRHLPTRSPLKHFRRYINPEDRQIALNSLASGDFTHFADIRKEVSTSAMIEAYISRDGAFALLQLTEYVPHHFQPTTPVHVANPANIPLIQSWLNK